MKVRSLSVVGLCLFLMVGMSWEVGAFNGLDLVKVKSSKYCPKCDLSGANLEFTRLGYAVLPEANLSGANLTDVNIWGANLKKANLERANLSGANLNGADLTGANLTKANLTGASLWETNLGGANLEGANLSGAVFTDANLNGANLTGIKIDDKASFTNQTLARWNKEAKRLAEEKRKEQERLAQEKRKEKDRLAEEKRGKNLDVLLATKKCSRCKLDNVNLSRANLSNADLSYSNLTGADLTGANLSYADLSYSNLTGADLTGANLSYANLNLAGLEKSNLTGANMTGANLTDARIDDIAIATNKTLRESKRKKEEEAKRLAEEKRKQEEKAKRLAEEKRKEQERLAQEKRKEQERLAKEQRKIELEKVALNPGFKGLKLGLTRQEIVQLNVCDKPTLGYYLGVPGETPLIDGQSCYKRKGWTFSFYFTDDRLSELRINLGVYTREYEQEIHELLEDKYPVYYEPNKREKKLFFVGKSDKTDWVYRNGEVVLSARYACKQEDAVKDKCYLPGGVEVDYPPEQTAKDEDLWAVKAWCEIGGDGSFMKLRDQYPYACMWATPSLILRYLNTREASVMLSNFPNQELKSGDF